MVVEASIALELAWLVGGCGWELPVEVLGDGLTERVETFWPTGSIDMTELLVIAERLDCLVGTRADALFELERHDLAGVEAALATEDDAIRENTLERLGRLEREVALRRRYSQLIADVWAERSARWETIGRAAVNRSVLRLRASIEHGQSPLELLDEKHLARRDDRFSAMTQTAYSGGRLMVAPSFFSGHRGCIVDLPRTYLVGTGSGVSEDAARRRVAAEQAARGFKLLADPTRVLILSELRCAAATVGEIARRVGVAQPTASVHLKQLRDAGLVEARRDGATTTYTLLPTQLERLIRDGRTAVLS